MAALCSDSEITQAATSAPASSTAPTATFTLFPTLVPELRLKIWGMCVPGPRTVKIKSCTCCSNSRLKCKAMVEDEAIPGFAHACRESREVALKDHDMAFGARFGKSLYFNHNTDTLYFSNEEAFICFATRRLGKREAVKAEDVVKRIVIRTEYQPSLTQFWYHHLAKFSALETLKLDYVYSRNTSQASVSIVKWHFAIRWEGDILVAAIKYHAKRWPQNTMLRCQDGSYVQMDVKRERGMPP
jgi:hypothetical protein